MGVINYFGNPLESNKITSQSVSISILDWMDELGIVDFKVPTIAILNGSPLMREDWGNRLTDDDIVMIVALAPRAPALPYIYLAIAVASVAMTLAFKSSVPKPGEGQQPDADPVYTLSGKGNKKKIQQPIEVCYGRNRMWPSLASSPYTKYENDNQYLYTLLCLGQGWFNVHRINIEDTPIAAFQDVQVEVIPPGKEVTLFPDNIVTSIEVSSLELFGQNEPEYPGWSGPFSVNPPGTTCSFIEVDITLPNGLYYSNDNGGLDSASAKANIYYRRVDDEDRPLSEWEILVSFEATLNTVNAKRFTEGTKVPPGRYQVRGRRTNDKNTSHRAGNTIMWAALRAELPNIGTYGDVTLLAIKALASNNLNDNSNNRFNVVATRLIDTWSPNKGWTKRQPSRSPVWAFCDIFRSQYGGRLDDKFLDLEYLYELSLTLEGKGINFDWIFDQKSTVWDSSKVVSRVGRGVSALIGSQLSIIIDEPLTLPSGVFNQENIVKDSFKWDISLWNMNEFDSVEMEYIDPITYQPEVVVCSLPGITPLNPEKVTLAGCTDRDVAYREGMYIASNNVYVRENISFQTGLEGNNLHYGSLISISHDLPRWGQGGYCVSVSNNVINLSDIIYFTPGVNNYILLRARDGSAKGPYPCTKGPTSTSVTLSNSVDLSFIVGGDSTLEPTLYAFGVSDKWSKLCKVVNIKSSNGEIKTITATNYDTRSWQWEDSYAPPKNTPNYIVTVPDSPVVKSVSVEQRSDTQVLIRWPSALGAVSYLVESSKNGADWTRLEQTSSTNYLTNATAGLVYFRVAGINVEVGPWAEWSGIIGSLDNPPGNVLGISLGSPFIGSSAKIDWLSVLGATSYRIIIRRQEGGMLRNKIVNSLSYLYTYQLAEEDGANARSFLAYVTALNSNGESLSPAVLEFSKPQPAAIVGVEINQRVNSSTYVDFNISWSATDEQDLRDYRLWLSTDPNFKPSSITLVYVGNSPVYSLRLNKTNGRTNKVYFYVAALDNWDEQTSLGSVYSIDPV